MTEIAATLFSDRACFLGEGPTYDPATDTLWWFDIVEKKLLERRVSGGPTIVHHLPVMASALAVIDEARQLVLTETGFHIRDVRTGALALHTAVEADNADTRSNDARVHPSGSIWFGTMGKSTQIGAGAIYWFRKGEVRKLYPGITIPNSICFSPDGAAAYFTDTETNVLMRAECDPATGLPIGEPRLFVDRRAEKGGLDGSVVDADGVVWNARWGGACIDAYSPDGRHIKTFATPVLQPSCPAFAGVNADRLAFTSAWQGMNVAERAADPHAGKTFTLDITVNGRFEPKVLL